MAIRDDILTLKNKEGTLTGNKVCNFAYDDTAFEDDTTTGANGVSTYNYNNHNNIPVKDVNVLKVNPTIISKGFRSQVSTLSRMLLNHIFGRVSYNLNKTVDTLNSLLTNLYTYIGQPNGLATLDNTGRLPYSQLPLSAVEYKGAWNANTNTPTLASGTGTFGDEYIVSTQGTQNIGEGSITYRVGDRVIYNGSIWQRIPASSLRTVNSKTPDANGNVTINASDIVTPDVYGYDRTVNMGKSWTQSEDETTSSFTCVYYANGIWVAGSSHGLWWSTDGKNWTQGTGGTDYAFKCVYFAEDIWIEDSNVKGLWVAGSNSHGTWWSTDGKNWTQGTGESGYHASRTISSIYYSNGIWVAGYSAGMAWSTDGKNWITGSGFGTSGIAFIALFAKGIWVAVHDSDEDKGIYWSTDGKSWTRGTNNHAYVSIYFANGIWVAGTTASNPSDTNHGLWWSTDGKNWTQGTGGTTYSFYSIYYANGIWVAGSTGHGLWWSTDGKNWTQGTGGTSYTFYSIYYANGIWVAGSTSHGTWWSIDGKNWTQGTGGTSYTFRCVYSANGIWVAGSTGHGLWYSIGTLTNNVATILDWLLFAVDNLLD